MRVMQPVSPICIADAARVGAGGTAISGHGKMLLAKVPERLSNAFQIFDKASGKQPASQVRKNTISATPSACRVWENF
ncbi:MAG: hypothetical protein OEL86_16050 [Sulfuritalea sp.]|nr:hypothetical protein [Sulfuritalea sp.]